MQIIYDASSYFIYVGVKIQLLRYFIIVANLNEFYKGKTVVIVAHRLSTVKYADNIIVLEKGKIVEQGRHSELSKMNGSYFHLVKNQLELGN